MAERPNQSICTFQRNERKEMDAKENVVCNAVEIFPASLELLPRIFSGTVYVLTTSGDVNPTKRSATNKFIRRKEVQCCS